MSVGVLDVICLYDMITSLPLFYILMALFYSDKSFATFTVIWSFENSWAILRINRGEEKCVNIESRTHIIAKLEEDSGECKNYSFFAFVVSKFQRREYKTIEVEDIGARLKSNAWMKILFCCQHLLMESYVKSCTEIKHLLYFFDKAPLGTH